MSFEGVTTGLELTKNDLSLSADLVLDDVIEEQKPLDIRSQSLKKNGGTELTKEKNAIIYRRFSAKWPDEIFNKDELPKEKKLSSKELGDLHINHSSILHLLQHGIKFSLSSLLDVERDLLMTDFAEVSIIYFSKTGPNFADSNFVLCTYAPTAFRFFRELYGIGIGDFMRSVCEEPLRQFPTTSKSGSKVYTSYDNRFLLKTCSKKEADFLINLFPGYFLNITQHPKTLLPKYFGLYRYRRGIDTRQVLIMHNLLPTVLNLQEVYDLKGSTYSRRKADSSASQTPQIDEIGTSKRTLKDLDFLERCPHGMYLNKKMYNLLMKSIERDCKVLESHGIMDYSLLLGIHRVEKAKLVTDEPTTSGERRASLNMPLPSSATSDVKKIDNLIGPFLARTWRGEEVHLYLGIIDILQNYTLMKKLEHIVKSLKYSSSTISVSNPRFYSQRFQKFLKDSVFKCIPELIASRAKDKLAQ